MADEASAHDAFAQALGGGEAPAAEPTHEIQQDAAPQIAQDAPQDGSEPEGGTQQPIGQEAPQSPQERAQEAMVPSWRLREINEQRERERAERQAELRELAELRRFREEQEAERQRREAEGSLPKDFYESDPSQFIDQRAGHLVRQGLDPVQRQMTEFFQSQQAASIHNSRLIAGSVFGADKVKAAEEAFNQAAKEGRIDPAEHRRINSSPNPFEAAVQWHQRQSTLDAIGGDLDGYNQRQQEALLKDPAFLARALEAHRSIATPVQTGVPGRAASPPPRALPSLNRQTSSRDGSGEGDVGDVFASVIAERGRRAG